MLPLRQAFRPLGRIRQQYGHNVYNSKNCVAGPSMPLQSIIRRNIQTQESQSSEGVSNEDFFSAQRRSFARRNEKDQGYTSKKDFNGRNKSPRRGGPVVEEDERFANPHQIIRSIDFYITRSKRHSLSKQMVDWGISGEELKNGATRILGTIDKHDSDEKILKDLLLRWWEGARPYVRSCMDDPLEEQAFWDTIAFTSLLEKNANFDNIEIHRIVVNSFLGWLERNLTELECSDHLVTHLKQLQKVADMRYPSLNSTMARMLTRTIHLHVGPTNSGKTHGALQALCKAKVGMYAGPLRLLAHEVWDRINNGTVSPNLPPRACNLITGEERRVVNPSAGLLSCTVEMANPGTSMDVAVIDEIQMIGDPERGYAWTAAVMNIAAKEIHLCGESSVIPLIKRIADDCGDKVIVHEYQRLTPLRVGEPLFNLKNVQKGDCVVAFSRTLLFNMKDQIEKATGLKCAIAYGALPPETKSEQAKLFNDPNNDVDIMVASDAIGMGLNLKIKRVIFTDVCKWNGKERVQVSFSQIKQIAGRAGRFGTREEGDEESGGIVTTLNKKDLDVLKAALEAPLKPITHARIAPEIDHISRLAALVPTKVIENEKQGSQSKPRTFGKLLSDIDLLLRIDHSIYVAGSIGQQSDLVPYIEAAIPSKSMLTLEERSTFSLSPVNTRDEGLLELFGNMVHRYAQGDLVSFSKVEKGLNLLDTMKEIESLYPPERKSVEEIENEVEESDTTNQDNSTITIDFNTLSTLETLHRGLTLYRWLAMRFPVAFPFSLEVESYKGRAENAIDFCLESIRANRKSRLAALGRTENRKKGTHSIAFENARSKPSRFNKNERYQKTA